MNLRIILADDHPFVLLGIRAALEARVGVKIVGEAATPTALIALLQGTPCDVLVTDLSMREPHGGAQDGLGLIQRIRRDWPRLRVVVITTLMNTAILRAIVSDGAVSTLGKVEPMEELWRAIEAARRGEVHLGRSIAEALAQPGDDEVPPAPAPMPAPRLSWRQAEVVRRLADGQSVAEIAAALGCERRSVNRQRREAMYKLGVTNEPGLFAWLRAYGMTDFESHI
nr:Transcriptional regulatory protein RcsB [Paraburkholderia busanensis]